MASSNASDAGSTSSSGPRATAYQQVQSAFFSRLPPEIRDQIYHCLLDIAGPTQHIYKSAVGHGAAITHTRCYTDPDTEDEREKRYLDTFQEEDNFFSYQQNEYHQRLWGRRQNTDWCNHWLCEETTTGAAAGVFLGPLLACRRAHDEFAPVLYSGLTFSFVNVPALRRFVDTTGAGYLAGIRSVLLVWCTTHDTHAELDPPDDDAGSESDDSKERILRDDESPDNIRVWRHIWSRLAAGCPQLSHVRIWIYGGLPRFPMPNEEYFKALDDFARYGDAASSRRLEKFTVTAVWTRETESITVDGREVPEDDGALVPDSLRNRTFKVSRVAATDYEPETWMAMWANPPPSLMAEMGKMHRGKGWGVRGEMFKVPAAQEV